MECMVMQSELVLIQDVGDWHEYQGACNARWHFRHVGEPERYPCLVFSELEDEHGSYHHRFVYVEDARRLLWARAWRSYVSSMLRDGPAEAQVGRQVAQVGLEVRAR